MDTIQFVEGFLVEGILVLKSNHWAHEASASLGR